MLWEAESLGQQFFSWPQGCVQSPKPMYMYMDMPTLPMPWVKIFSLQSSFSALICVFGICPKSGVFPCKISCGASKVSFPHQN